MPLRTANNPTTDQVVLSAIAQVAPGYPAANTALGLASGPVYVQQEYQMLATGQFPAVLIQAGAQGYSRMSQRTYNGQLTAILDYYDLWAETTRTFDQIRAAIAADLELMKSNLESNDSLTIGSQPLTVSMPHTTLSPYQGIFRTENGVQYIYRRLTCSFWLLDYSV